MPVIHDGVKPALMELDPRDILAIEFAATLKLFQCSCVEMTIREIAVKMVGPPVYNCSTERCVCGESAIRDFEALPVVAGNESLSLLIADNGFVHRVPGDLAVQPSRDSGKVAR
jgi:hypothetical protein